MPKDLKRIPLQDCVPLDAIEPQIPPRARTGILKSPPTFFQRWAATAPKRNVAMRLARMRAEAGYTHAEVARRAGWNEEFVSRLEDFSGPIPDEATIARFAAACGQSTLPRAAGPSTETSRKSRERPEDTDSVIGPGITIEGHIVGSGDLRICGKVLGDVNITGNLILDPGARVDGEVSANGVIVGGDLHGNVEAVSEVRLLATGTLMGDMVAGSASVAAGARMRGQIAFGDVTCSDEQEVTVSAVGQ